eukprot:808003_1
MPVADGFKIERAIFLSFYCLTATYLVQTANFLSKRCMKSAPVAPKPGTPKYSVNVVSSFLALGLLVCWLEVVIQIDLHGVFGIITPAQRKPLEMFVTYLGFSCVCVYIYVAEKSMASAKSLHSSLKVQRSISVCTLGVYLVATMALSVVTLVTNKRWPTYVSYIMMSVVLLL